MWVLGGWGRTEGPQEDGVPGSTGPWSSVQPVSQDWQQLGRSDHASSGCHPSPGPTSLVALAAGIEMEIVNSCEADNGGCSHGCSHSSAGSRLHLPPWLRAGRGPRGHVSGASGLPSPLPSPKPEARCCPGAVLGFDAVNGNLLFLLPPVPSRPRAGVGCTRPGERQHHDSLSTHHLHVHLQFCSAARSTPMCCDM